MRTAAASAVATRYLAREDAATLGLIGAGALAREHLAAIVRVREISRVVVWSRTDVSAARFADDMRTAHPNLAIEPAATPKDVVTAADIVCTLTPSRLPIVMGEWFTPGLHVNAVGAPPRADHREIDATGMARARVVVDSVATALHESGDALMAIAEGAITAEDVSTELGEVIVGAKPGRTGPGDVTLFNSVGIAMQDLAIGALILERARARGVGTEIDLAR
jgi:ornithine cyclodeaminase/alanine dehydrogenase